MPADTKPLFRPEALRKKLDAFLLPDRCEAVRLKFTNWARKLNEGKLDKDTEIQLLPIFLTHIFEGLLGYIGPVSDSGFDAYTMKREMLIEVDGKRADAAFGQFGSGEEKYAVVLEGKGPLDTLDRPFAGRKRSAVDQALSYAVNLKLDWYIVTNLKEIRLYSKQTDQFTFERFEIGQLASNDVELRRFVFLLSVERVLQPDGKNHLDDLFVESKKIGRELTAEFYGDYRKLRQDTFDALRQNNPDRDAGELLAATQKLLDRILFIAFCEDRELLPKRTIAKAFLHSDPYNPRPIWDNFRGVFRAIDKGDLGLEINQYNGKLYAPDAFLDTLIVPDAICEAFEKLASYEYGGKVDGDAKFIDVEILGHVFEQSISDLEEMQNVLAGKIPQAKLKQQMRSARKEIGAIYTPAFITRYIVQETLRPVLDARFVQYHRRALKEAEKKQKPLLKDPTNFDAKQLSPTEKTVVRKFWNEWIEELETIRIIDPSCGSGAFLIEAFNQLYVEYVRAQGYVTDVTGKTLFDIRKTILEHNLYGVDLIEAAVGIARLSCWIQTAEEGKKLTSLDHNFRHGNSVVTDPAVHPDAFDWQAAFPEVFANGGFDVVVGNPPYVRQEWIKVYKAHFEKRFPNVYAGTADLYVYFYALGLELLKPDGRLGYISSNSFVRARYAQPLRQFLAEKCQLHRFADLGDTVAFSEAKDVYPAIVILSKLAAKTEASEPFRAVQFRRKDRGEDIAELLETTALSIYPKSLNSEGWKFDSDLLLQLRSKLRSTGQLLESYAKGLILTGIKTGLNEAFVLSAIQHEAIVKSDDRSHEIIRPFVQGTNAREWHIDDSHEYLIVLPSSSDRNAPWSDQGDKAESVFAATYPAVHAHLDQFRDAAIKRSDQGRFWWELRSCAYWAAFEKPKIVWPDITNYPRFSMDLQGRYLGNTGYIIPGGDYYLLGVLSSIATWFTLTGISIPFGERAGKIRYRLIAQYMEKLPIPDASPVERQAIARLAELCNTLGAERYRIEEQVRHRLLTGFRTDPAGKLNEKAQGWWELDFMPLGESLKTSFKRKQNPFSAPRIADEWEPYLKEKRAEVDALRRKLAEAEAEINERVYRLFALTADEVALLKQEVEH